MRVTVDLLLPNDERVTVGHGAMVGRLSSAQIHLSDPRISEAHAMFSLRGRCMRLLALRGGLVVDGKSCSDIIIREGMTLHLAKGLALRVLTVNLPDDVLGLKIGGLGTVVPDGNSSVFSGTPPRITTGWDPKADDWIWPTPQGWLRGTEPGIPVHFGDSWTVGNTPVEAVACRTIGGAETERATGFSGPILLEVYFDTVHIKRKGEEVLVITGASARILSELVYIGCPTLWSDLARTIWGEHDLSVLRRRWDTQLYRLRRALRRAGVSPRLVNADGSGLCELVLRTDDVVSDRS